MAKRRVIDEGSIYFNEKIHLWVAQITLLNGKRKSKSGKTQKVVLDWLIDQRTKVKDGLFFANDGIKLGVAFPSSRVPNGIRYSTFH
jgi:hypothetical protein